jgi:hypothetical protein
MLSGAKFELITCLGHPLALIDFCHLHSIEIVGDAYAHYVPVTNKYFYFVNMVVLCFIKE